MTATGTGGGSKHTDIYYKLLECFRITIAVFLWGVHWRKQQFISLCNCCSSVPFRPHQNRYLPTKHFPNCFLSCFCVSLFVECPSLAPAASVQVASSNKQRPRPRLLSPPYLSVSPSHSPTAWLWPDTPTRINKTQPTTPPNPLTSSTLLSSDHHFSVCGGGRRWAILLSSVVLASSGPGWAAPVPCPAPVCLWQGSSSHLTLCTAQHFISNISTFSPKLPGGSCTPLSPDNQNVEWGHDCM